MNDQDVRARVAQVEQLLGQVESFPDPQSRAVAMETVQILLELYGEGLARIMARAASQGRASLLDTLAEDELISHLLLLHGLHPQDVETRVQAALDAVRPHLAAHGGDVELLGVHAGVAHLRLMGSCNGCTASATTLQATVEQAIEAAAPDLLGIETKDAASPANGSSHFIPISALMETDAHG